ncbi:MAG: helix-turn-helix domain-containing protein [Myxococcota bacterium]|nr:helix-turn-helix domain-containing protein [Myxococcota bacterium]
MGETAMTVREVASYLSVTEKTVYRLAQKGKLPGFKVAGAWRFRKRDIEGWIEEQKQVVTQQDTDIYQSPGGSE